MKKYGSPFAARSSIIFAANSRASSGVRSLLFVRPAATSSMTCWR